MELSRRKRTLIIVTAVVVSLLLCCLEPVTLSAGLPRKNPGESTAPGAVAPVDPRPRLNATAADSKGKEGAAEKKSEASPEREATGCPAKAASGAEQQKPRSSPKPQRKKASRPKTGQQPSGPPSFLWGCAHRVIFSSQVQLTNSGKVKAENIWVDLPMLENSSPYQETRLKSTNFEPAYMTGRVGSFGVGDLAPGEAVVIKCDYEITMRPLELKSTNETVEKARQIFELSSGSGNCGELARGFVRRCRDKGIKARLVKGYAGTGVGKIAPGNLKGRRHSWAEFYIDGLGWVPVDLTFGYFAALPHASHVVETYADKAVKVYHLGGKVDLKWVNQIR